MQVGRGKISMPLAVANRYAAALAQVVSAAQAETSPEQALTQLESLEETIRGSAELRGVLETPAVSVAAKHKLLNVLASRLGLSKPIRNLAFVLIDNGRVGLLAELTESFRSWLDERNGVERIRVTSAAPLDNGQQDAIVRRFEGLTGKRVQANFAIDDKLLGGTVVRVGSRVYDGSLARQLRSLSRAMAGSV